MPSITLSESSDDKLPPTEVTANMQLRTLGGAVKPVQRSAMGTRVTADMEKQALDVSDPPI